MPSGKIQRVRQCRGASAVIARRLAMASWNCSLNARKIGAKIYLPGNGELREEQQGVSFRLGRQRHRDNWFVVSDRQYRLPANLSDNSPTR